MDDDKKNLLIGGLLGLLFYFILPAAYKVFSFLIPAIALSLSFSKKGFSVTIFLTLAVIFVLFPSSYVTLSVGSGPISFDPNLYNAANYVENVASVVGGVFLIGIPILAIIGAIYAFYIGQIEQAINIIIKLIAVIIICGIFFFFAGIFNWRLFGVASGLKDFADLLWALIKKINDAGAWITKDLDIFNIIPDIPEMKDENGAEISLDGIITMSVGAPDRFALTICSIYPLILSGVCLIIGLISAIAKNQKLYKFDFDTANTLSRPRQINYSFLIYLAVLLAIYFATYLWLGSTGFAVTGGFIQYQELGYFTIYLSLISFSCLVMAFGFGSVSNNNANTALGVIYGISALYLLFNFFTAVQLNTVKVLGYEYNIETLYQILIQFIAIAPAESLFFHVALPAMVLFYLFNRKKNFNNQLIDEEIALLKAQIQTLNLRVSFYQTQILKPKLTKQEQRLITKEVGDNFDFGETIQLLSTYNAKIIALERSKLKQITPSPTILKTGEWIVYIVCIVLFNFVFSSLHWFNSGLDFRTFWACGLGLIYLLSGCVINYVSYRYGWLAGILVHALNNSLGLLIMFFSGV